MTEYIVRLFENGVPQVEMHKIEAADEQEAAERLCGVKLTNAPRPQIYLRADVRVVQRMNDHHHFYEAE